MIIDPEIFPVDNRNESKQYIFSVFIFLLFLYTKSSK